MIRVDTREKNNSHITNYFTYKGIPWAKEGLTFGDYYRGGKVCVERKASLLELSANLGKHHDRFRRELLRARDNNVRMVVLIEQPTSLEKVKNWKSDKTTKTGKWLLATMRTVAERYGVEWRFCHRLQAGEEIIKILEVEDV